MTISDYTQQERNDQQYEAPLRPYCHEPVEVFLNVGVF